MKASKRPSRWVTGYTCVWFDTFMNTLDMAFQIVLFSKAFVTRITFQGFHVLVNWVDMPSEVTPLGKSSVTRISSKDSYVFMKITDMSFWCTFSSKVFVKSITWVSFDSSMNLIWMTCERNKGFCWSKLASQKWHWFKNWRKKQVSTYFSNENCQIVGKWLVWHDFTWLHKFFSTI